MIKMSFFNGTLNREEAIAAIQKENKPCVYTFGFKYKNPTTRDVFITKEEAIELVKKTSTSKFDGSVEVAINLNLDTNDISDALGRGKHTTRHVELYYYKNGTYIIDTPGFSALEIAEEDVNNIKFYFKEFKNDECKFRDCNHINEIGCKVKYDYENNNISKFRYENYKKMVMKDEDININY